MKTILVVLKIIILFLIFNIPENINARYIKNKTNFFNKKNSKKSNLTQLDLSLLNKYKETEIIVKFKSSISDNKKSAVHKRIKAKTKKIFSKTNISVITLPENLNVKDAIDYYSKNELVEYAEPNYRFSICAVPNDPMFGELWGLNNFGQNNGVIDADIDAPEAWDLFQGDTTVVVGIIDTGIDYTHEDLKANLWINKNEIPSDGIDNDNNGYIDDIYGINSVYDSSGDVMDDNGHGTHVAGTIGAVGNNNIGVAGVNLKTKIMALKFISNQGYGYTDDAIECIEYVLKTKETGVNIKVLNNSWGGIGYSKALYDAIKFLDDSGVIFVAAAGNYGLNTDEVPFYPSCYNISNIISVAAMNSSGELADFSNYGINSVDIAAPGVDILSTVPGGGFIPQKGNIFFDDMETGEGNWEHGGTTYDKWTINSEKFHSQNKAWNDSPGGNYSDNTSSYLAISKNIDLTSAKNKNIWMGFWTKTDLEWGYDELRIEISKDGGTNWDILSSLTGENSDWELYTYYIPEVYKTTQFKFRFHLEADYIYNYDGVYIDDVGIGISSDSKNYESYSGTSMAAPHVTGAIAFICGNKPSENFHNIMDILFTSSDQISGYKGKLLNPARINLYNAISQDINSLPPIITNISQSKGPTRIGLNIKGRRFGNNIGKVNFNPDISSIIGTWNDTTINCVIPDGAKTGDITITKEDGKTAKIFFEIGNYINAKTSIPNSVMDAAIASLDGKIYVIGGAYYVDRGIVQIYDYINNYWKIGTSKSTPCIDTYAETINGKIYIAGGLSTDNYEPTDILEIYDPILDKWTKGSSLPTPLLGHVAATVDGKLYIFGGINNDFEINSIVYEYNPETDQWRSLASLNHSRAFQAVGVINKKIYIFGGVTINKNSNTDYEILSFLTSTEVYDPIANTFTELAEMNTPRFDLAGVGYNGKLYAIGGSSSLDGYYLSNIEVYDPIENKWEFYDCFLSKARNGLRAVSINSYIYILGGYNWWWGVLDINEYLDTENRKLQILNPVYIKELKSDYSIGLAPIDITFNVACGGGTEIYKYLWDFGDGSEQINLQNPLHTYTNPGKYNAKVIIKDIFDTTNFSIGNLPISILDVPKSFNADLTVSPITGAAPLKVTFTVKVNEGAAPYDITWDFGDKTSTKQTYLNNNITITYTYNSPGIYKASVITSSNGIDGKQKQSITNKLNITVTSTNNGGNNSSSGSSSKKMCIITGFLKNQQILFNFNKLKDKYLLNNFIGKFFVNFYYGGTKLPIKSIRK